LIHLTWKTDTLKTKDRKSRWEQTKNENKKLI